MNVYQRLKFFIFGLLIGLILVIFCFGKRIYPYSYLPNGRVLNNIRKKKIIFYHKKYYLNNNYYINNKFIFNKILIDGKINFKKSIIQNKYYPIYEINYIDNYNKKLIIMIIENRQKIAIIQNIKIMNYM